MDEAGQELRKLQAQGLFKSGKLKESESLFNSLVESPRVGSQAKSGLGFIYIKRGQNAEARDLFKSVISSGHPVAEAYYGLGRIFEDSDPSYARAQYEFALGIFGERT
jgi:tetratricopeptide (TPR) repeat protein